MENVCHTLVGGALARAGLDRMSPLATATMLIAANLPDVDIAVTAFGDLAYLQHHRGITHSVLGLVVEAPLLAGAVCLWDRAIRRRRRDDLPHARFWALVIVAAVGLASHLALDFTNSYGVKPWLPFDATWYYADLVFIVDPWLWLMLGGALFVGSAWTRSTNALWLSLLAVMAAAVIVSTTLGRAATAGAAPAVLWSSLLIGIVIARLRFHRVSPDRIARVALVGVIAYWSVLAVAHACAVRDVERADASGPASAIPTLMRPDRWETFVVTPDEIHTGVVRLGSDEIPMRSLARRLDDPAVRAASVTCAGSIAVAFNRFLYADVEPQSNGATRVVLKDARFGSVPGPYGFASTRVDLAPDLTPVADARRCSRFGSSW